jgi:hypothetical protein
LISETAVATQRRFLSEGKEANGKLRCGWPDSKILEARISWLLSLE